MNRPTSVRIGHRTYKIEWISERAWLKQDDESALGIFWYDQGIIRIRSERTGRPVSAAAQRETLTHEILHACWAHANMDKHGAVDKGELEEWVVGCLSFPLIQVLTDNPRVLAWLTTE